MDSSLMLQDLVLHVSQLVDLVKLDVLCLHGIMHAPPFMPVVGTLLLYCTVLYTWRGLASHSFDPRDSLRF